MALFKRNPKRLPGVRAETEKRLVDGLRGSPRGVPVLPELHVENLTDIVTVGMGLYLRDTEGFRMEAVEEWIANAAPALKSVVQLAGNASCAALGHVYDEGVHRKSLQTTVECGSSLSHDLQKWDWQTSEHIVAGWARVMADGAVSRGLVSAVDYQRLSAALQERSATANGLPPEGLVLGASCMAFLWPAHMYERDAAVGRVAPNR